MADIPRHEDGTPKVQLRVGIDDNGFLYLYDAVTGREVARQKGVSFETYQPHPNEDFQAVVVCVNSYSDPRLFDNDALKAATREEGDWTVEEYMEAQDDDSGE